MKEHPHFKRVPMMACIGVTLMVMAVVSLGAFAADLVSVPSASFTPPTSGGGDSFVSRMSPDGRYVLFSSTANNLAQRTNGLPYLLPRLGALNVFLRDRTQGATVLVSADAADAAQANADSIPTGISTNGQYALFESTASNLVAGDINGITNSDIFVRDLASKATTLVTIATNGGGGNGPSSASAMTPDGRYVVFSSSANNLVAGDTNGIADIFVRDVQLGVTKLVSAGAMGTNVSFMTSASPTITPDGRYVCFMSTATNLVPGFIYLGEMFLSDLSSNTTVCVSSNAHNFIFGSLHSFVNIFTYNNKISDDGQIVVYQASASNAVSFVTTNGFILRHHVQAGVDDLVASNAVIPYFYDRASTLDMTPDGRFVAFVGYTNSGVGVFVWDGQTGTTVLASADTNGAAPAKLDCDFPAISADGRYVVFVCDATNLTANSVGAGYHFYRRDIQAGTTEIVDVSTNGAVPARSLLAGNCSMSADGRFVAFDCADSDLVTNDSNLASDVFVRDFNTETTELVSQHSSGLASQTSARGYHSNGGSVSADGRYVAFASSGGGLLDNYTNIYREIIVRDLLTQSNFLVSVDPGGFGDANGDSGEPMISANGRYVAFSSYATNLVSGDTNVNSDVFVRDLQAPVTVLASINAAGTAPLSGASVSPSISSDGRYVLFLNGPGAILRDQLVATNFVLASNGVTAASMTPDGRYVAFYGTKPGGALGLYVWDSQLGATIYTNLTASISRLNISSNGQWLAYIASSSIQLSDRISNSNRVVSTVDFSGRTGLKFSLDGNSFVYATRAPISGDDTNGIADVYVYDVPAGTNFLVSRSFYTGKAPNGVSDSPDISADGRFVVYSSSASDIVPTDDNGQRDVFLYDRQSGTTALLSASSVAQDTANFISTAANFTGDGQTILFHTWATDIATNDFNQRNELLMVKILSSSSSTNPPPVFTGQILFSPGSGSGNGQTAPQLIWAAQPGFSYQVQYKNNLSDDVWLPVNGSVVIQGGQGSVRDFTPDPGQRFYRVVAY
jgi:Tol biopolymer transport system component